MGNLLQKNRREPGTLEGTGGIPSNEPGACVLRFVAWTKNREYRGARSITSPEILQMPKYSWKKSPAPHLLADRLAQRS